MRILGLVIFLISLFWGQNLGAIDNNFLQSASGDFSIAPRVQDAFNEAIYVSRIRIVERQPVWSDQEIKRHKCGYIYSAEIIESFKGVKGSVKFFSSNEKDFVGLDEEYLVFIYHRDVKKFVRAAIAVERAMPAAEFQEILCRISQEDYVPENYQVFRAFDSDAALLFGGRWLAPVNRPDLVWCEHEGDVDHGNFITKQKKEGDISSAVLNWESVKNILRHLEKYPNETPLC